MVHEQQGGALRSASLLIGIEPREVPDPIEEPLKEGAVGCAVADEAHGASGRISELEGHAAAGALLARALQGWEEYTPSRRSFGVSSARRTSSRWRSSGSTLLIPRP